MALLLKNGAVFMHIPKTGGNWVRTVLDKLGLASREIGFKHAGVERLLPEPYLYPDYYKTLRSMRMLKVGIPFYPLPARFTFVRHPITWYESWFKFLSEPRRNWSHFIERRGPIDIHTVSVLNGCGYGGIEFNDFVKNVIEKSPGFVTELYSAYTRLGVQFMGRQENLRKDLIKVLQLMKADFDPEFVLNYPRVRVSAEPDNPVEWDKDVLEEVTRLEYAGIRRYGYEKDFSKNYNL